MEVPHFVKSEPEWSPDTKVFLKSESEDYFPPDDVTTVKTETEQSSDAELNAKEENGNSFCESETEILKEEIIKEEEDISRRTDDFDVPASSSLNVLQESAQDLNLNNDLRCDELKYSCVHCEKVFKKAIHLRRHVNDSHKRKGTHECKECKRLFTWHQNLSDHIKTNCGKKPLVCSVCNKSFMRVGDLRRHMVIHTADRSFECAICSKVFNVSTNLASHLKVHSEARPYPCNICNKMFRRKAYLKRHTLIHTGVRPYSCSYCGMTFIDLSNFKKHMRRRHSDTP